MTSPTPPQIVELDHVGIVVPDLTSAVEFFTSHFGATIVFTLDRFIDDTGEAVARIGAERGSSFAVVMLSLGERQLELLQWWPKPDDDPMAQTIRPNLIRSAHIAIAVPDVQRTIDVLRADPGVSILSDAVTFTTGPTPGLTNAFFTTSWGFLIELVCWPENTTRHRTEPARAERGVGLA